MKIIQEIEQHYNIKLEPIEQVQQWGRTRSYCAKEGKILSLNLRECGVKDFPFLAELPHLQKLDLSRNALSSLVFEQGMTDLDLLDISYNKADLQVHFNVRFPKLQYLYIYESNLQQIELQYPMPVLNTLHLAKNKLQAFSLPNIRQFKGMETLYLKKNNIDGELKSFAEANGNSWEGLKNYLSQIQKDERKNEVYYNDEAKLVFIGNTDVGKTTLAHQLVKNEFDHSIISTHGIKNGIWEIDKTDFGHIDKWQNLEKIYLNLWDFGGQEYYHSTHRLFLTSDSLYLLLWSNKAISKGTDDLPLEYWRKNVQHYTDENAPIIEIQNRTHTDDKCDTSQEKCKINSYHQDKNEYEADIQTLKKRIIHQLAQLNIGEKRSRSYYRIKQALEERAETKTWLTFTDYSTFCQEIDEDMKDPSQLKSLTEYLDRTGSIVCFRFRQAIQSEGLNQYVFIKPQWLTETIYKILEKEESQFSYQHVFDITEAQGKEDKISAEKWIDLMQEFELIFPIEEEGKTSYIVPQYLPENHANQKEVDKYIQGKAFQHSFSVRYTDFLSKSTFLRFIAQYGNQSMHFLCPTGERQKAFLFWKNGLVFTDKKTKKAIYAHCHPKADTISIQIEDNDPQLAKEIFDTLYTLDHTNLEISAKENEWHRWEDLKTNYAQHKGLSEFGFLFGEIFPIDMPKEPIKKPTSTPIYEPEKRLALVVGCNEYEHAGVLKNAVNDAVGMQKALEDLSFDVDILLNPKISKLRKAIDDFGKKIKEYEVGLFYFAGHGIQIEGINYLLPKDAELASAEDVEYECVAVNEILKYMKKSQNKGEYFNFRCL